MKEHSILATPPTSKPETKVNGHSQGAAKDATLSVTATTANGAATVIPNGNATKEDSPPSIKLEATCDEEEETNDLKKAFKVTVRKMYFLLVIYLVDKYT